MMKKLPPAAKAYEAMSAIADGRICMHEGYALADSSDHSKTYEVQWDGKVYASTDSATYWQGYPGYPVIAVWMLQGILPHEEAAEQLLKGIGWKQLNEAHRRDYDAAVEDALNQLRQQGVDPAPAVRLAAEINARLPELDLEVKKGRAKHIAR